jgi:hypothetical protein
VAPPGSNLLLNPGAGAGDTSKLGWDAVTIPGWQVSQGLPTVVSYGTKRFPGFTGAQPAGHPARLFAGGAGGAAVLTQQVPLRAASGHGVPPGCRDTSTCPCSTSRTRTSTRSWATPGRPRT